MENLSGVAGQTRYTIQVFPCEEQQCVLGKLSTISIAPLGSGDPHEIKNCPNCNGTCVIVHGWNEKIDTKIEENRGTLTFSSAKYNVRVSGASAEESLLRLKFAKEVEVAINRIH